MLSLPKPHLAWSEPRSFRKAIQAAEKSNPLVSSIPFLVYFGVSMLLWNFMIKGQEIRDFGFAAALAISTILALVLTLGIRLLHDALPSKVSLAKVAILRQNGTQNEVWRYDHLQGCNLAGIDGDDGLIRLELLGENDKVNATIGIGKEIDVLEVSRILASKGLKISIEGEPVNR